MDRFKCCIFGVFLSESSQTNVKRLQFSFLELKCSRHATVCVKKFTIMRRDILPSVWPQFYSLREGKTGAIFILAWKCLASDSFPHCVNVLRFPGRKEAWEPSLVLLKHENIFWWICGCTDPGVSGFKAVCNFENLLQWFGCREPERPEQVK